jgi:hypothetical protein
VGREARRGRRGRGDPGGAARAVRRRRPPALIFYRLALTEAQAIAHALLDADGKAEVDRLPVPVLVEAIEALHDPACAGTCCSAGNARSENGCPTLTRLLAEQAQREEP